LLKIAFDDVKSAERDRVGTGNIGAAICNLALACRTREKCNDRDGKQDDEREHNHQCDARVVALQQSSSLAERHHSAAPVSREKRR
jgi:hypothetical protein